MYITIDISEIINQGDQNERKFFHWLNENEIHWNQPGSNLNRIKVFGLDYKTIKKTWHEIKNVNEKETIFESVADMTKKPTTEYIVPPVPELDDSWEAAFPDLAENTPEGKSKRKDKQKELRKRKMKFIGSFDSHKNKD